MANRNDELPTLSNSELDAIKAYMDNREIDQHKSIPWKGRLVIKDDTIVYDHGQSKYARFLAFIGYSTEAKDIENITKKRIQRGNFKQVDPRLISLCKTYLGSNQVKNQQLQAAIVDVEEQFSALIDKSDSTLVEMHPYLQALSSIHIQQIMSKKFGEDPELYLQFLNRLYTSSRTESAELKMLMTPSAAKLIISLPHEISHGEKTSEQAKAAFARGALAVVNDLYKETIYIITYAKNNHVSIGGKGRVLGILASAAELIHQYPDPDKQKIGKKADKIFKIISDNIQDDFLMPFDSTNRESIRTILKFSEGIQKNIINSLRELVADEYEKAITAGDFKSADQIIYDLPDQIRYQIICPLMIDQSDAKVLLLLFRHFPKEKSFPKEYIDKIKIYCKKAFQRPIDYKAVINFLVILPEKEQIALIQQFMVNSTMAERAALTQSVQKAENSQLEKTITTLYQ